MTDFVDDLEVRTAAHGWVSAPTLWELVERRVAATPDAVLAHEDTGAELTFAQYRDASLRVAAGLHREFGIGEGSAVSWELPTWNESLVLVGALSRLGARQNPLIPIYRNREVSFITGQSDAELLIVPPMYRSFDFAAMAHEIAATRDNLRVLVSDRTLPQGDPKRPPAGSTAAGIGGRGSCPMAVLYVGDHCRSQGGPAHRSDRARLGVGHERVPGHP